MLVVPLLQYAARVAVWGCLTFFWVKSCFSVFDSSFWKEQTKILNLSPVFLFWGGREGGRRGYHLPSSPLSLPPPNPTSFQTRVLARDARSLRTSTRSSSFVFSLRFLSISTTSSLKFSPSASGTSHCGTPTAVLNLSWFHRSLLQPELLLVLRSQAISLLRRPPHSGGG